MLTSSFACTDDGVCRDGVCLCRDVDECTPTCGRFGCDVTCERLTDCDVACGEACATTCRDLSSCVLGCGSSCGFVCERAADCAVECGDGCNVTCRDVGECTVRMRSGEVLCDRVGRCDVECVDDLGASAPATECGDGRRVCGTC
ncbi:MAG: hypothetical protein MUE69_20710 [Myxococcota bacterium]|nr:hypothetical protein [Myxococcota bacterium]